MTNNYLRATERSRQEKTKLSISAALARPDKPFEDQSKSAAKPQQRLANPETQTTVQVAQTEAPKAQPVQPNIYTDYVEYSIVIETIKSIETELGFKVGMISAFFSYFVQSVKNSMTNGSKLEDENFTISNRLLIKIAQQLFAPSEKPNATYLYFPVDKNKPLEKTGKYPITKESQEFIEQMRAIPTKNKIDAWERFFKSLGFNPIPSHPKMKDEPNKI